MKERLFVRLFLLVPSLVVLYFVFQIFRPFILPIALAIVLVSLCYPVFAWIAKVLKGRKNLASLFTCILVVGVIVIPLFLLLLSLAREVGQVYAAFQAWLEGGDAQRFLDIENNPYLQAGMNWLRQYVDLDQVDLVGSLTTSLRALSLFFLRHSTAILGGFANVVSSFFLMVITMFFLFRDGEWILRLLSSLSPLTTEYEELLVDKFKEVTKATILGSLATALAQGFAGGLLFWILGIPNVIFWASLMALFSLVPLVGTSIVWVPWAAYLAMTGSYARAIILVAVAVLVIGMLDNILRPLFIEGKAGMHTMTVFFSIMGGIAYFGMTGMIFGPIIVSIGLTFVELYRLEFQEELVKPSK